jgi:hypothetical protein
VIEYSLDQILCQELVSSGQQVVPIPICSTSSERESTRVQHNTMVLHDFYGPHEFIVVVQGGR